MQCFFLTCLSQAHFSTQGYKIFDTIQEWRTKCGLADFKERVHQGRRSAGPWGSASRLLSRHVPRRLRSMMLMRILLAGAADSGNPAAPGSTWQPWGLRDRYLSSPAPVPETQFGELWSMWGPANNCIPTPEARFWGVTKPQLLEAYVVGTYFLFPLRSPWTIRNWIQASVQSLLNQSQAAEHPVRSCTGHHSEAEWTQIFYYSQWPGVPRNDS